MSLRKSIFPVLAIALALVVAWSVSAAAQTDPPRPEQMDEKAFKIIHADPMDIYQTIRVFITPLGKASLDRNSKLLIVQDTPENLAKITQWITEMDIAPEQLRLTFFAFNAFREEEVTAEEVAEEVAKLAELPDSVQTALSEIRNLMNYRRFALANTGTITVVSTGREGSLTLPGEVPLQIGFNFDYNPNSKFLRMDDLRIMYQLHGRWEQMIRTDIGLENTGVAVVGGYGMTLPVQQGAFLIIVTMQATAGITR